MARHLKRRRRGWYFQLDIPQHLRHHFEGSRDRRPSNTSAQYRSAIRISNLDYSTLIEDEIVKLRNYVRERTQGLLSELERFQSPVPDDEDTDSHDCDDQPLQMESIGAQLDILVATADILAAIDRKTALNYARQPK